jgi:hypothetical protein
VKAAHHKELTLKKFCTVKKINIWKHCSAYHRELAKMKAHGVHLIRKIQKINSKGLKSPAAIRRSMLKSVRAHLLVPFTQPSKETMRKQLVSSLCVVSDIGSKCMELNTFCCEVANAIQGPMRNRFRFSGGICRTFYPRADFVETVLADYLVLSGFRLLSNPRKGSFEFRSVSFAVVEKAFGGAENMSNGRNPFVNINCIKSDNLWKNHKQVNDIPEDAPVVKDPRDKSVSVGELRESLAYELEVPAASLVNLCRSAVVNRIIEARISNHNWLGMEYIHGLVVSSRFPFLIVISPARNGLCKVQVCFQIKKEKVVVTLNQPVRTEAVY